ncbi:MAG: protein kinase [Myxococcales bacterium]|nr:protein kinase [Myxococcales bacterium]
MCTEAGAPPPKVRPGDLLEGRYEIEAQLGTGGTARVFRARDHTTKAIVAIKVMDPELEGTDVVAYFMQEGRLAARIRDPHLIAALQFGQDAGRRFIVYDYMPGAASLSELAARGRLAPRRVCNIALQILYGLHALHRAGVVHGDVSLNNCLWREHEGQRDEALLIDLGRAWTRPPCPAISGGPTSPPEGQGTAGYTAPEILFEQDVDHRADLWSVGAVMYALLTFREVDLGESDGDEPLSVPSPRSLLRSIPQVVSDVVMRALAGPDQRYPSAALMIEAVQAALAGLDAQPRRRGMPMWIGVAGVVSAAALGVFGARASLSAATAADVSPSAGTDPVVPPETPAPTAPPDPAPAVATTPMTPPAPVGPTETPPGDPAPAKVPTPAPVQTSKPNAHSVKSRLTWAAVEQKLISPEVAATLYSCSSGPYVSLELRVVNGRARLMTIDGVPVQLPRDRCAVDAVARLRFFAQDDPVGGVVGVPLDQ